MTKENIIIFVGENKATFGLNSSLFNKYKLRIGIENE